MYASEAMLDEPEVAPEAPDRRVLVVDGDARSRREIGAACGQDGFEVLSAEHH